MSPLVELTDGLVQGVTTRAQGSMKSAPARAAALAAAGLEGLPVYFCRQVHGTAVVRAPFEGEREADGVITDRPDVVLSVFMADCIPLFLWKPGGAFGVFHSGWRGTALGMPKAAVRSLTEAYGVAPRELRVSMGAHIGPCCFEAREDCFGRFPEGSRARRGERVYVDLFADASRQLREAGVVDEPERPACTACSGDYFSFRRDKVGNSLLAFAARRSS